MRDTIHDYSSRNGTTSIKLSVLLTAFDLVNNNIVLTLKDHRVELPGGKGPWVVSEYEELLGTFRLINTEWKDGWCFSTGKRRIRAVYTEYYATEEEVDSLLRLYTISSKRRARIEDVTN